MNKKEAVRHLGDALKIDYSMLGREWAYHGIKPCIVAEELLTERGLKVSKSKLRMKEADPKYRDYEDTQVIDSNPKQGVKVKIGTTVCLRYITAEVIEESQKIFDDSVRIKQEAKEQKAAEKQEKKERLKESVSETMDSAKSGLEKIFKKDRKAIEAEKGEK